MSARELARVGLLLLGVYLIVGSLVSGANSLTGRPFMVRPGGGEIPEIVNSALVSAAMALVAVILYGILPGTILIAKSRSWATAWFPDTPHSEIPITVLVPVGLVLLGINFGVEGLGGVFGGLVQFATQEDRWLSYALRTIADSSVSLIAGVALFVIGRRLISPPR